TTTSPPEETCERARPNVRQGEEMPQALASSPETETNTRAADAPPVVIATNVGPLKNVDAPARVRSGAALPSAVRVKTKTEVLLVFATTSSSFTVSTTTPSGWFNVAAAPIMVRSGATLPFTVRE